MKKVFFFVALLLLVSTFVTAQVSRTSGMGGVTYSIKDIDHSFDPYDLGKNPAWLALDETETWLRILPSIDYSNGNYKKYYDPQSVTNYNLGFRGVKPLGVDGTFLGETYYSYEMRRDINRSLKYDTYGGEAFFMADTTQGTFRYNGPSIKFMYSFELFPDLYLGASVNYRILDGLKNVYSRATVLYREVGGTVGLAYRLSPEFSIGLTGVLSDDQEKIEAKSEDLTEVEIFNFRGETYSVRKRSSSVNQTIRKKGRGIGTQLYYTPDEKSEYGLHADLFNSDEDILIPYSTSTQSFEEYSEGYASFQNYNILFRGRYELLKDLLLGGSFEIHHRNSWSKNPARDLLLWEWKVNSWNVGIGASYQFDQNLLLSLEYEFEKVTSDSSKYIDSRSANFASNNHLIRTGIEQEIFDNLFARAGFNYGIIPEDILSGGKDVNYYVVTLGTGLKFNNSFDVDLTFVYNSYQPKNENIKRTRFGSFLTVKLFSF
ncbi:MAG: hypothetical protein Q8N83_07290 [Ignavibacteria bacterium]|nr:hypothetical protein [Ignavibacteria bacterium]